MIEHYGIYETAKLNDRFGLADGVPKGVKPRYNVCPTQAAPVVVIDRDGSAALRMMNWGLVPANAKNMNSVFRYKTFNVRSEKVFSKPVWNEAVRHRRCIIPANGFYMQRKGAGNDDVYYFTLPSGDLFALAGIYTTWTTPDGDAQSTFTLLTIDANEAMPLPFGRMPVIIHSGDETRWINTATQDFGMLVRSMRPYEGAALAYRKVSKDVSAAKVDSPRLIDEVK